MRDLLNDTAGRAARYLESLRERRVAPAPEAANRLQELDHPLPVEPTDPARVLALLDEVGSPATVASAGGRYFGFVLGGSLPVALAANWLAGAWDQNAGLVALSPIGAVLEEVALRWLVHLFGLPAGTGGAFVTGATMANFSALAAARHALLARAGWDVEAQGLFGAPPITVVVGDDIHPLEEDGLDRVLPRPQRQRKVAQRPKVCVEHQSRATIQANGHEKPVPLVLARGPE